VVRGLYEALDSATGIGNRIIRSNDSEQSLQRNPSPQPRCSKTYGE